MTEAATALTPLLAAWCAAVGAVVGSFLNVVIARVPEGLSVVRPGSRCPRCGTPIRWYDNVPIVSWLALRARCRSCGTRISARYPLVEALGSAAALVAWHRHGLTPAAASEFAFVATLVALAFIDLDTWLLPNVITWPLIASGLTMAALGLAPARSLRLAAFGAGLGFGAFALLSWLGEKAFKKEALGFGDVWLLAGLGAWMGPAALLPIALLASLQGSVVGIALILVGKGQKGPQDAPSSQPSPPAGEGETEGASGDREREESSTTTGATITNATDEGEDDWVPPKHALPFGPFLVAGALEWLWLGGLLAHAIQVLRLFR